MRVDVEFTIGEQYFSTYKGDHEVRFFVFKEKMHGLFISEAGVFYINVEEDKIIDQNPFRYVTHTTDDFNRPCYSFSSLCNIESNKHYIKYAFETQFDLYSKVNYKDKIGYVAAIACFESGNYYYIYRDYRFLKPRLIIDDSVNNAVPQLVHESELEFEAPPIREAKLKVYEEFYDRKYFIINNNSVDLS